MARGLGGGGDYYKHFHQRGVSIQGRPVIEGRRAFLNKSVFFQRYHCISRNFCAATNMTKKETRKWKVSNRFNMQNKNFWHAANFAIIIIARLTLSNSIAWQCYHRYIIPTFIVSSTVMVPASISSILIHSLSTMSLKQRRVKFQEGLSTFSSLKLWEGHSKYSFTCSINHNEPFFAKNS